MRAVPAINGTVAAGFERVREAFAQNFAARGELGGACCVYHHGQRVVDLWGGLRHQDSEDAWDEDTMVLVYSTTKGLSAMTLALLHSRGLLDYDQRVATYWPEFAQNGKERITVRQLLAHQAGLFGFDETVDRAVVADLDRLAQVMARQAPAWEPGTRQAYHAISLGFYEGELVRRIDPQHRSLGRFFQEEIATPLGIDTYIRLPETIGNERFATLAPPPALDRFRHFPLRLIIDSFNKHSVVYRSLITNPGTELPLDPLHVYTRNLEVPSGGGVTTARGLARAYDVFANGRGELGLKRDTIDLLTAPALPPIEGFHDACLHGETQFLLGFMKSSDGWPFGGPSAFGAPGAGGSLGFADPASGIAYGYVTCQMGAYLTGDPRDIALRDALAECLSMRQAA